MSPSPPSPLLTFPAFLVAQLLFYFLFRRSLGTTPSRRAWLLSFFNASVTTCSGLYHLVRLYHHGWDDVTFLNTCDHVSQGTLVFFMAFLTLDLVVGFLDYREKVGLLTGYVHHVAYFGILAHVVSAGSCVPFNLFLFEELPTWILATGAILPGYRSDVGFGVCFFATRLVLHGYLLWNSLLREVVGVYFAVAVVPLHVWWFMQWARQQRRILGEKKLQTPSSKHD